MRRLDSFTRLLLLAGGTLAGLAVIVGVNGAGVIRALTAPHSLVDACLLIFSLGPPESELVIAWFVVLFLLLWLSGRLTWEVLSRWVRTLRVVGEIRRQRMAAPPAFTDQCTRLGLAGRVDIAACAGALAFCYGLWSPRILLSSGLLARLTTAELEAVLLHERVHLLRRDPFRLLLARSLAATFPAISLIPALAQRVAAEQEVAADQAAVQVQGRPHHLAAALFRLLTEASPESWSAGLALSGLSPTSIRLEALIDPAKTQELLRLPAATLRRGMSLLAATAVTGFTFTLLVQAGHVGFRCPLLGV